MRLAPIVPSIFLALTLAGPALAGLGDRKTLVIEGRTIDPDGAAIAKVRVWADGARHASTVSDHDGNFSLRILLGTPNDLRRGPMRLSIQAAHKGFRFTTPGGDPRLGLEIALEAASGGLGRCVARSNDARFAASAARVVAVDGEAVGLTVNNFLGVKGEPARETPWPKLEHSAQVALSFAVEGAPGHELEAPAPDSPTPQGGTKPAKKAKAMKPGEAEARERRRLARESEVERALADIHARETADSILAAVRSAERARKKAAKLKQQEAQASQRSAPTTAAPSSAARATPPPGAAVADSSIEHWRDAQWHATTAPPSPSAPAPQPSPTGSTKRGRPPKQDPHEITAAAAAPGGVDPVDPWARDVVELLVPSTSPVISPEPPLHGSRARSAPLVIRSASPADRPAPDTCECRVEGTLEVRSDEPLKNRERIEVSFQWYPQLRDTVELYMGSPRHFKLPPAPCGPQRLRLRTLTDGQFAVLSPSALAAFRCNGDRVLQPRIVLVPR